MSDTTPEKQTRWRVLVLLRLLANNILFFSTLISCRLGYGNDDYSSKFHQVEVIVDEFIQKTESPGMSVAVGVGDELVFANGFGQSDIENNVPVTSETRFRTASIAKSLTAVTVLAMSENGSLDLDEPIRKYLPEFPKKQWEINLQQLLGHLAGVRHYRSGLESLSTQHYESVSDGLKVFADDPLRHQPGSKYLYSTFGYNLAGAVAEQAAGESYMDLLSKFVLIPAEMNQTVEDSHSKIISCRSRGYVKPSKRPPKEGVATGGELKSGLLNAPMHDTSMKIPGGGLLSTPSDLIRFACALNTGRLLTPETCQRMWDQQTKLDGSKTAYGLGWKISQHRGWKMVSHSGGQAGVSTLLILFPESGISVALMCNLQNVALTAVAKQIANLFLEQQNTSRDYSAARTQIRQAIEHESAANQLPSISIGLANENGVFLSYDLGFPDAEQSKYSDPTSHYRFDQLLHLVSAAAVMKAVDRGLLNLDLPVESVLAEWRPREPTANSITLRHLLSHRAGLVQELPIGNQYDLADPKRAECIEKLRDIPLCFAPGSQTKFSRASIVLVNAVLEAVNKKSLPQVLREDVLDPLQMSQTVFDSGIVQASLASAWNQACDGRRTQVPPTESNVESPSRLYSTVGDAARLLAWMLQQSNSESVSLLTPSSFQELVTPLAGHFGSQQGYGLGVRVQEFDGYPAWQLSDSFAGTSTLWMAVPEIRWGVVLATSAEGQEATLWRLANHSLRLLMAAQEGDDLPEFDTRVSVPAERMHSLVGHYQSMESDERAQISSVTDKVYLRFRDFRQQIYCRSSDGSLLVDDSTGAAHLLSQTTSGDLQIDDKTFRRIAQDLPDDCPDDWNGLVGDYGPDQAMITILEDSGRLTALVDRRHYCTLNRTSPDTFQFENSGPYRSESLSFQRDSQGLATEMILSGIRLSLRGSQTDSKSTFKIQPIRPIDQLRLEALQASPPAESRTFRKSELQELITLDSTLRLDIRYATENNFAGSVFYQQARAFLQLPAAQAVSRVQKSLQPFGLGLLIHDAYRPWIVTKMFWEATPHELRNFVANPSRGSRHNRGCAVDLSLFDLATGEPITMVSGYDEFTPRSFAQYPGGTSRQRYYRDLLRHVMEREGFRVYEDEWWHFDYHLWQEYAVQNVLFETISDASSDNPELKFEYPTTSSGWLSLADGFHGIWYMNQPSKDEYAYKYSGGMATYPWQHHPIAIYRPEIHRTYFVYGGRYRTRNTLLHCVSYFDHATGMVARPRVLLDKKTDDAHDNPVLCIDDQGYLYVFSSAHGTSRPAYIHRSRNPYQIDAFDCISTTNFSYPQPWNLGEDGLLLLHTRYQNGRALQAMRSLDAAGWSEPRKLAHIEDGHYQVSQTNGNRIATAFNFHPKGKGLNYRTNIYYMQSSDAGQTWSNVQEESLSIPLLEVENPALVFNAASEGKLCYLRCLRFTSDGRPVILFVKSGGYQSGPQETPRQFMTAHWTGSNWQVQSAMECDNNYDFADLEIRQDGIWQISGATQDGPQSYNTGGEIAFWHSTDEGASWQLVKQLTNSSEYNHNFPRKPVNAQPDFYLLWADGHARQPSESALYFTDRDGTAIWKLPEEIVGNELMVKPIRYELGDKLR